MIENCRLGIDTNFLIDLDNPESPRHNQILEIFNQWRKSGTKLYIYSQIFLEYQHIITDSKRFSKPLTMEQACQRVEFWKNQERIQVIHPDDSSFEQAQNWIKKYNLGRKRIIDTHIAAAYFCSGIDTIVTSNPSDFEIFNCFQLLGPD